MKPDLTLLTGGFSNQKEIKFTNLVALPTPVDSTQSELLFSPLVLSALGSNRNKKSNQIYQTWSNQPNLISNRGPKAGAQSLPSRAQKFFRGTHTTASPPRPRPFSGVARCLDLKDSGVWSQFISAASLGARSVLFRIGCLKFESIANHLQIRSVLCTRNSKMTIRPRKLGSSSAMGSGRSSTMRATP
jgi:hypothetical protein